MNDTPTPRTDASENMKCEKHNEWKIGLFGGDPSCVSCWRDQQKELTAVTAQRDGLAKAIITHRAKAFPLCEDFDQELWQALKSLTPKP